MSSHTNPSRPDAEPTSHPEDATPVPDHEVPFDYEAGERLDDGSMDIGESLTFQPADPATFDRILVALLDATHTASVETGYLLDAMLFADPDDDEVSSFVVFNFVPDDHEWAAVFLLDHTNAEHAATLETNGWWANAPRNYVKSWPGDTDLTSVIAEVGSLVRTALDEHDTGIWQFGVSVLAPDPNDSGVLEVVGEAAPLIARRAIATALGDGPEDPATRRATCEAFGLYPDAVYLT